MGRWDRIWKENQQQISKSWKKYAEGDKIDAADYSNFIKNLFNNIPYKFFRNRQDARHFYK